MVSGSESDGFKREDWFASKFSEVEKWSISCGDHGCHDGNSDYCRISSELDGPMLTDYDEWSFDSSAFEHAVPAIIIRTDNSSKYCLSPSTWFLTTG